MLIVALTLVTGSTDAIGYLSLGGVFTSVMTANMVLLGVSGGRHDGSLALHAGAAVAGFLAGNFQGSRIVRRSSEQLSVWPRTVTVALAVELVLFMFFAVWWEVVQAHPTVRATYALIAFNAIALGIQSAAVLRFGIPGLSTTYFTGILTHLVSSVVRRDTPVSGRAVASVTALILGGVIGAVLAIDAPRAAPVAPLGVLALVLIVAAIAFPDGAAGRADEPTDPAREEGPGG